MRVVIQRVAEASVTVDGQLIARIDRGLLILVGIAPDDDVDDAAWLAGKIARMRIFPDDDGRMNRSVVDVAGDLIAVSQFTLFASTAKGNRPAFTASAPPDHAKPLYETFVADLSRETGRQVGTGRFAAHMDVALVNDGPVTIVMDSKQRV